MAIVNPLRPIDNLYRIWLIDQIYVGPTGPAAAKYVPNVNDKVEDWNSGITYRVTFVDINSGLSTLEVWNPPNMPDTEDRFLGTLPHYIYSVFMLYVNTGLTPHPCAVDNRVRIFGTEATKCKVFVGIDLTDAGQVVSRRYNELDEFLGEDIPLITVKDTPEETIKVPDIFYTNISDMANGESCTLVAYNDDDVVVYLCRLIVVNTNFIREIDSSKKYITNIYLETTFGKTLSTDVVQVPSNVILADIQKHGVVVYSNGEKERFPVDGTKFALGGLNDFMPTVPGARIPMSLVYNLAPNEVNNMIISSFNNAIIKDMWIECLSPDGAYGVKLFVIPVWQNTTSNYRLEYYLYSLNRDTFYQVTSLVEYANDSPGFDADLLGVAQTLGVSIDLSSISGTFVPYRHVQTFTVILKALGNSLDFEQTRWEIIYENGQNPKAGAGWFARKLADMDEAGFSVDISCGALSTQEWLNKLYWPSKPIYNLSTEGLSNITPTHYRIRTSLEADDVYQAETPISLGITAQTIPLGVMPDGEVVFIDFVKKVNTHYLEMATVGLPIVTDIP